MCLWTHGLRSSVLESVALQELASWADWRAAGRYARPLNDPAVSRPYPHESLKRRFYASHPAVLPAGGLPTGGDLVVTSVYNPGGSSHIKFIRASDSTGGGLEGFSYLMSGPTSELEIVLQGSGVLEDDTLGGFRNQRFMQLLSDPTSAARLYVVYTDRATYGTGNRSDSDLNIVCKQIEMDEEGYWHVAVTRVVNRWDHDGTEINEPDSSGVYPDAICSAAFVDGFGRVHVVYYDTANMEMEDSAIYDMRYAILTSPGSYAQFKSWSLRTDLQAQSPSLDASLLPSTGAIYLTPREYSGLSFYHESGQTILWAAYAGTSVDDPESGDQTVLFASKITVPDP